MAGLGPTHPVGQGRPTVRNVATKPVGSGESPGKDGQERRGESPGERHAETDDRTEDGPGGQVEGGGRDDGDQRNDIGQIEQQHAGHPGVAGGPLDAVDVQPEPGDHDRSREHQNRQGRGRVPAQTPVPTPCGGPLPESVCHLLLRSDVPSAEYTVAPNSVSLVPTPVVVLHRPR